MKPKEGVPGRPRPAAAMLAVVGLLLLAAYGPAARASGTTRGAPQATFAARGSVEQVQVTGASPGGRLKLVDRRGELVDAQRAGSLGGIVFRRMHPGGGYRVRQASGAQSPSLRVLSTRPAPPSTNIYDHSATCRPRGDKVCASRLRSTSPSGLPVRLIDV